MKQKIKNENCNIEKLLIPTSETLPEPVKVKINGPKALGNPP